MPAPTNISFVTATDLGTISTTATTAIQTVDDAGTTYTVYYKFTAASDAVVIGAWGFGDLTTYTPTITPYLGPAGAPAQVLGIALQNKPIQFPVAAGSDYFLKLVPNGGNPTPAILHLSVVQADRQQIPRGALVINDDTTDFPLLLASSTTSYQIYQFINPFPNGEAADVLSSGISLWEDATAGDLEVFDNTFTSMGTLVLASGAPRIRACRGMNQFYVGTQTNPVDVHIVTAAGAYSTSYTLTGITSLSALAASNDGAILYHTDHTTNPVIRRWDLPGNAALTDLAPSLGGNYRVADLLVLPDDSIVALWWHAGTDCFVKQYQGDGTVLQTVNLGVSATPAGTNPRLAYGINGSADVWVWMHDPTIAGLADFTKVTLATGATSVTHHAEYEEGEYQADATDTPLARFGPSFSCPFFLFPAGSSTTTFTIRRQRRWLLPQSESNKRIQIPLMELLMRTGIGLLPDAAGSSTPLGVDPEVRLRISKDGGKTWGPERARSAGLRGEFKDRVRWTRATGNYRNGVGEVTVDAPVDWQWLAMMGDVVEGSS